MTSAIFIDTNIPAYASGREHAYKDRLRHQTGLKALRPSWGLGPGFSEQKIVL